MKKLNSIIVGLILGLSVFANAAEHDHTQNYCSDSSAVCLHLGFHWGTPTATAASQFMTHFMFGPGTQSSLLTDVQIQLWMPDMGHGSSPVVVKQLDAVHFQVSEAYFFMPGFWQVLVDFKYNGAAQQIAVPLTIQ